MKLNPGASRLRDIQLIYGLICVHFVVCVDLYILFFCSFGERMDGSSYEEIFLLIQVACVSSRKQILPKLFFLSIPSDQSIG